MTGVFDYDQDRLEWLLIKCQEIETLTDWEFKFVSNLIDRRAKYGDKLMVSERMMEVLERIAEKE